MGSWRLGGKHEEFSRATREEFNDAHCGQSIYREGREGLGERKKHAILYVYGEREYNIGCLSIETSTETINLIQQDWGTHSLISSPLINQDLERRR